MTVTVTYSQTTVKPEFGLNTYTTYDQLAPSVLGLSNGGFVGAYNNGSLSNGFILLNFYDADHNVVGTWQQAYGTTDTDAVGQPVLTQLANGNVLVAWDDDNPTTGEAGIKGRIFTSAGVAVGNELDLTGISPSYVEPSVTALSNGGFVTTYGTGGSVYFRLFDADGVQQGGFHTIDATGSQADTQVAALAGGGFTVTWTDNSGADSLIKGMVFDDAGAVQTAEFTIGSFGDNTESSVAALPNGNFAVAYTDTGWGEGGTLGAGITLQIFTPSGANVTPGTYLHVNTASTVDESQPDVTVLPNGFILVSWTRPFGVGDNDIMGRIYDQSGNPITVGGDTDEFYITSSGTDDTASSVSALLGGEFLAAWQDSLTDGDGGRISAQVRELTRTVVGDSAADSYTGDQLRDSMDGAGGNDTLSGGENRDTIFGGSGSDLLDGGGGGDLLQGGLNGDTIHGGEGNDLIYAMAQADIDGSSVADSLDGGFGDDKVYGSGGADTIDGGSGDDRLYGRDGEDSIGGSYGDDKLKGGKGADLLEGGYDADTLIGGGGDDTLFAAYQSDPHASTLGDTLNGGGGNDVITGSDGSDYALGGIGNDALIGNDGADTLNGGSGKDTITGGAGADSITGGGDKDIFVYGDVSESNAAVSDVITDLANGDRIDLHLIDADTGHAGNQGFHLVAAFSGDAGELVVTYHSSGPLTGMTSIEGDVDGDGVADLTILATGDHHTYTNFVL